MIDKLKIRTALTQTIDLKLSELEEAIKLIEDSAKEETKSSAGDKYETSRAMLQQEKDKKQSQLELWQSYLAQVKLIDSSICDKVEKGALVETSANVLYVSVPIGKFSCQGLNIFGISIDAPIYQAMKGYREGQELTFNNRILKIKKVY